MNYSGSGGFALLLGLLIGFALYGILFLIGFLPGLYLSRRILSEKKGKRLVKSQTVQLILSIGIALVCGYASFAILSSVLQRLNLFG